LQWQPGGQSNPEVSPLVVGKGSIDAHSPSSMHISMQVIPQCPIRNLNDLNKVSLKRTQLALTLCKHDAA
jgi:hypothetical protein